MKRFFTPLLAMCAMLMATSTAHAQETEVDGTKTTVSGYFRLTNPGFGDALSVNQRYNITAGQLTPTNAGNIIEVETGTVWSFAQYVEELNAMLEKGEITDQQYTDLFTTSMTVNGWKGGLYPIKKFSCQGVDYVPMIKKLKDYAYDAVEDYLNDEIPTIYEQYRQKLTLLCIFASDVITPSNLETVDTFRAWAEAYLTKWLYYADFNMYLNTVYSDPVNDTDPLVPTGEYYITFKTPIYVGNMKKAQEYINNMVVDDGSELYSEKLDLWGDSKVRLMRRIAKDYPVGSDAYNFLEELLGCAQADMVYIVGETEEGKLYIQPLPDTFGTNGVTVTADDVARCTWMFNKVDNEQPYAVAPTLAADGYYYTTLCTAFPCQTQNAGTQVYYASSINENGEPTLVEIADGKVPAQTPVIIKSLSANMQENTLLPLSEDVAPIEGQALNGVLFETQNTEATVCGLAAKDGQLAFNEALSVVPANTAYSTVLPTTITNLNVQSVNDNKVYNLQGHQVKDLSRKGVYVVNGRKVVR